MLSPTKHSFPIPRTLVGTTVPNHRFQERLGVRGELAKLSWWCSTGDSLIISRFRNCGVMNLSLERETPSLKSLRGSLNQSQVRNRGYILPIRSVRIVSWKQISGLPTTPNSVIGCWLYLLFSGSADHTIATNQLWWSAHLTGKSWACASPDSRTSAAVAYSINERQLTCLQSSNESLSGIIQNPPLNKSNCGPAEDAFLYGQLTQVAQPLLSLTILSVIPIQITTIHDMANCAWAN